MVRNLGIYVCTRAPNELLKRCLASLANQTCATPWNLAKVVVAVNSSNNEHLEMVTHLISTSEGALRHNGTGLLVSEKGIPAVRNACLDHAMEEGLDALVFIDDDCIALEGWLESLTLVAARSNSDAVTGTWKLAPAGNFSRFLPRGTWELKTPPLIETLDGQVLHCSTASTRSVFILLSSLEAKANGLRFDLSRASLGGSDTLFFDEWTRRGLRIALAPGAVVLEDASGPRLKLSWFLRRAFRGGAFYGERRSSPSVTEVGPSRSTGRSGGSRIAQRVAPFVGGGLLSVAKFAGYVWGKFGGQVRYYY